MSIDIHVKCEKVHSPLSREAITIVARDALKAERVRAALLSITLVERRAIARINREHLGHRGATDVISFGFTRPTPKDPVVGDIYICPDVARENATMRGVGMRQEIARLVVHGVLHVLGYDHPDDDGRERSRMWKRQEKLLGRITAPVKR